MARSVNMVVLMGNLTRDPELRTTPNGQSVCSFGMALNRSYKDQSGNWQDATDYVDIVAWAQLGERVAQYCKKGKQVLVQGRLQFRQWEQEGQKRNKLEVIANDVTFLGNNAGSDDGAPIPTNNTSNSNQAQSDDVVVDDISDEPIDLSEIPF